MIPSDLVVDLSGQARFRTVRIIDGVAYQDRRGEIVAVADVSGEVVEVQKGRRWKVGEFTVSKAGGCSCNARKQAALKAFVP